MLIGALCAGFGVINAASAFGEEAVADEIEDVTILPTAQVKGAPVEDFGFRFNITICIPGRDTMIVSQVFPNSAASKAGLRPGDLITKIDGKSPSHLSLALKPQKLFRRKWAELEQGKKTVTLSLAVRASDTGAMRTLSLVIPSKPPRWGSKTWTAPGDRPPAVVSEPGPLAALAREVLDNGVWSTGVASDGQREAIVLGYEWTIVQPSGAHRIWVTQSSGRTQILLEHRAATGGTCRFHTSPAGAMNKASFAPGRKAKKTRLSPEDLRSRFDTELDFWLTKVGRVTGRWPFEALIPEASTANGAANSSDASEQPRASYAESFLRLPHATPAQRELLVDALNKVGRDADCWAYTETSRSLDDRRLTTVRYDPSLPVEQRCTLLKVDGKPPKAAYLKQWRDEGRGVLPGLGELPPIATIVDVNDVRVVSDAATAIVFELPVNPSNTEFPAEKFEARFRVNKTSRRLEDFFVKLREPVSATRVAKVTDAGFEARFQSLDPALAPQPVTLKMGGGVRVLLVKLSRSFEVTRTDFKRVTPFEPEVPDDSEAPSP